MAASARTTRRSHAAIAEVHELFPVLAERLDEPAANLSGGQQQMLALGMAFISARGCCSSTSSRSAWRRWWSDQLLDVVRRLRDRGTTIIIVEQSVNVALTVAERAYFMEKGEIRFHGPTAELLDRPDVVRSVFLAGARRGRSIANGGRQPVPRAAGRATPRRASR